jgi:hypothetical protein
MLWKDFESLARGLQEGWRMIKVELLVAIRLPKVRMSGEFSTEIFSVENWRNNEKRC